MFRKCFSLSAHRAEYAVGSRLGFGIALRGFEVGLGCAVALARAEDMRDSGLKARSVRKAVSLA